MPQRAAHASGRLWDLTTTAGTACGAASARARVDGPAELSSSEERDPGNGHNNTNDQRAVLKYDLPRNSDSNLNLGLRQLNLSSVWQDIPTSLPLRKRKS